MDADESDVGDASDAESEVADADTADPTTPPDRAFALLGDETRVAILRAVHESADDVVAFSDLRERVGDPDSGRFNYHLGELAGHFVARSEDGYELTQAGREVVRAVLAGSLTERPKVGPAPADADCPHCGGSLRVRYDGRGVVECPDCGATVLWNEFPPAGLEGRTAAGVASALDRWTRGRFRLAMDGVCPSCARETTTSLPGRGDGPVGHDGPASDEPAAGPATDDTAAGPATDEPAAGPATDDPDDESARDDPPAAVHRCPNCGYEARVPLFAYALFHPTAISLFHDAGVDVTDAPFWELRALVGDGAAAVEPGKPWTATVRLGNDDEQLQFTLDGTLSVTDVEPVDADGEWTADDDRTADVERTVADDDSPEP